MIFHSKNVFSNSREINVSLFLPIMCDEYDRKTISIYLYTFYIFIFFIPYTIVKICHKITQS